MVRLEAEHYFPSHSSTWTKIDLFIVYKETYENSTHHKSNPRGNARPYRRLYSVTASGNVLLAAFSFCSHEALTRAVSS